VSPPSPFVFDMPSDAENTTLMDGSSPLASVKGRRVTVAGPFPPGHTYVQIGAMMPLGDGEVSIAQTFPAPLEEVAVVVRKVGDTKLTSPMVAQQREMPADNEVFIAGTGAGVGAGQPVRITVSGYPHYSPTPRYTALALAVVVIVGGVMLATGGKREPEGGQAAERKRLIAKREKLFTDLVRLENDRRHEKVDERRYAARRAELVTALESIYGALEGPDAAPALTARPGVA
jgi:hypothetical protein